MKWSWKLGTVAGIAIYVHATFPLLILWEILAQASQGHGPAAVAKSVVFILLVFVCVVLHEMGHALTARRFGIRTRDITLLPIGGVARLERMPEDPTQEVWVAAAGPAVNAVIAAVLFFGLRLTGGLVPFAQLAAINGPFVGQLMLVNVSLLVFNLVPAFPMDGGRVLRAVLAMRMEYTLATQLAASIGQGIAYLMGLIGFFYNPVLLLVAVFIWIGAEQEAGATHMKSALGGIPVRNAMVTDFHTLSPHDSLDRVIELILSGSQHDFPVVEDGKIVGILMRSDLLAALARQQPALVAEVMQRDFQTAEPGEMMQTAFQRLEECACPTLAVLDRGRLVGMLGADHVGEFLMIQAARGNGALGRA